MNECIALNYIYLSEKHAGGKDQVGINLLKGFYENKVTDNMIVICYEYSAKIIQKTAPGIKMVLLKSKIHRNELERLLDVCYCNTFIIPRIIKKYNIKLIYHLSCNNGLKKLKTKTIVIPHDIKAVAHRVLADVKIPLYKYWLCRIQYYMDFKHADYIIAISDTDKNEIGQYYPKFKKKIKRIYNPIDVKSFKNEQIKAKEDYICAVNLQFHHKNIITLIKAFELIKDKIKCKLILIGSVPDRVHYLLDYVNKHKLNEWVKFTGFIEDNEMKDIFSHSKLYVNPTLYEGFGMTAIEAMIFKIPTLVSKIPTNYEITRGLCEYYYPPEDEKVLADKLYECINKTYDESNLNAISKEIYEIYNYRHISDEYYKFFNSILKV